MQQKQILFKCVTAVDATLSISKRSLAASQIHQMKKWFPEP